LVADIRVGDLVQLKKVHPCGRSEWEVVRVGADIRIRCTGCDRRVLLSRSGFEKRTKKVIVKTRGPESNHLPKQSNYKYGLDES